MIGPLRRGWFWLELSTLIEKWSNYFNMVFFMSFRESQSAIAATRTDCWRQNALILASFKQRPSNAH